MNRASSAEWRYRSMAVEADGGTQKDAVVQMFGLQAVFGPGTGELK